MSGEPPDEQPTAVHAYHLYDCRGADLGRIEHPAVVHTGDAIAIDETHTAIVVARTEACTTSSVDALLEVAVFRAPRSGHARRAGRLGHLLSVGTEGPVGADTQAKS